MSPVFGLKISVFATFLTCVSSQILPNYLTPTDIIASRSVLPANYTPPYVFQQTDIAPKYASAKWPNGRVPYTLDPNLDASDRAEVAKAIFNIESKTCIRFVPKSTSDINYVNIERDDNSPGGGMAQLCMVGGRQWAKIKWRVAKLITHELLHTLCFHHEQSRADRDKYLDTTAQGCNIEKFNDPYNEPYSTLALLYDYVSAMHYPCDNCMVAKMPWVGDNCWNADDGALSVLDAEKINIFYGCTDGCHEYYFRTMTITPAWGREFLIYAGYDPVSGDTYYVCRAYHEGNILVGRTTPRLDGCTVAEFGVEYVKPAAESEYMVNPWNRVPLVWKATSAGVTSNNAALVALKAIPGGRSRIRWPYYVGKCALNIEGRTVYLVGRVETDGRLWAPYHGKEHYCGSYELLTCGV
ncbi:Zinc metalloproteinase nas-1 [Folsomia candida]|uniref:Metalloendopeptidase n=1 Tax=Folsomia candida TaxID=158441 RepID=A0A226F3H8_FOLCA|nr:Zinc metalloproteinase nas-1 [Folsomia candida]